MSAMPVAAGQVAIGTVTHFALSVIAGREGALQKGGVGTGALV